MAEMENCLYSNNASELQRAKNDIAKIINSTNLDLTALQNRWNSYLNRFYKSAFPASPEILLEIEEVNQLFDNPR